MRAGSISHWLLCFGMKQITFLIIATAIVAIFWAITGQPASIPTTLIYTFVLANLTSLAIELAGISVTHRWFILGNLTVLALVIPVGVVVATAIVFEVVPPAGLPPMPRSSFWAFLLTTWKFPVVASLIFGGGYFAINSIRRRLESRNRQLQQTLETKLAEREVEAEELKQALDIQRGLLPKEIPQLPQFAIAGAWEPARVVGGDYYDVIQLSKEKLALCIADVAGKGISAALLMANVQAAVRAFAAEDVSPSRVCTQINSVLCTNTAPEKFVTLFYGILDAKARTLQYTNAGHPRPLLIRQNGETVHLENGGALLGVFPNWRYEDSIVQLERGDILLLFTDGITEAAAPGGEEFGEERLIAATKTARQRPMQGLQLDVLGNVREFCNSEMNDDATLLLIAAAPPKPQDQDKELHGKNADETLYAGVNHD